MAEIIVDETQVKPEIQSLMAEEQTPAVPETVIPEPPAAPPVIETPAAVVPPVTPPEPIKEVTSPPAPVIDTPDPKKIVSDTLKVIFGEDIDSEEKAKQFLETVKTPAVAPDPFVNEYVKGLNEYIKDGGTREVYDKVMTLDIDKLDAFNAKKTLMLWENPDLNEADVELMLNDKYRQTEGDSDEDKRIGGVHMATDGREAKKRLLELKGQYAVPEQARAQADFQRLEEERLNKWNPVVPGIVNQVNEIEVSLGENQTFKFTGITPESKQQALDVVQMVVKNSGAPYDAQGQALINQIAKERLILNNFPDIIKAVVNQVTSDVDAKVRAEFANPSPVVAGDPPPSKDETPQDRQARIAMARLSGQRV